MRQRKRSVNRAAKRMLVNAIGGCTRGTAVDHSPHGNRQAVLGHILMNGVVGETRERIRHFLDVYFGLRHASGIGDPQDRSNRRLQLTLAKQYHAVRPRCAAVLRPNWLLRFHCLANAAPMFTLRKREGDAPCPVPMVCIGWPLPQFGVPHSVHSFALQMASQEFQNSVVIPL